MSSKHANTSEPRRIALQTIRVSFDDLEEALRRKSQNDGEGDIVLRISCSESGFDEVETARVARTHPLSGFFAVDFVFAVELDPRRFYGGEDPSDVPRPFPDWHAEKEQFRQESGAGIEPVGTLWEAWWDEAIAEWEEDVKPALREELTLFQDADALPSVSVEIEWTDIDQTFPLG